MQFWEDGAQPHPQPLPVGEGSEYPRFLLEDGARRPPSYYGYPILILTAKRGLGYLNSRPGSLCPGLQQPNKQPTLVGGVNPLASCWRTGHGDHRPTWIIRDKIHG